MVSIYFGKKKIGVTALVVAALVAFALFCAAVIIMTPPKGLVTIRGGQSLFTKDRYIIHAGGFVEGSDGQQLSYTNSREALQSCYDNGNRICEIDLMRTLDGKIVCAHDSDEEGFWAYGVADAGTDKDHPAIFDEFMDSSFMGQLSTMSFDDLASFVKDHPDLYIVTDVKDDNISICRQIMEEHPELRDNMIIQIYHPDEYDKIVEAGFYYIIYTLYRATEDELKVDALKEFVESHNLIGVTFWSDYPSTNDDGFAMLKETKIPLFIHTINDKADMRRYIEMGISGIYTDVVNKEEQYL